jgi:solute carrier family 25 ornithine transporter 2/15
LAFWRGSLPAFLGALSENAVAFGISRELKRISENTHMNAAWPYYSFVSGGFTGGCTALVLCPSDVLKCRAQLSRARGQSGNIREIVDSIYKKNGLRGFYVGLSAQILRDIPFYTFFFGCYDLICESLKSNFPSLSESSVYFISGGFSGQIAWAASMPMDVVKSVMQTQEIPMTFNSTLSLLYRQRGIGGLYNGIGVAIIRAFPANAALFVGYEYSRKLMT